MLGGFFMSINIENMEKPKCAKIFWQMQKQFRLTTMFETSIIMEFKVLKKEKKKNKGNVYELLQTNSKEGLAQILEKKYRSGIPARSTKLVECGIAFQGKQACVLSRVLH